MAKVVLTSKWFSRILNIRPTHTNAVPQRLTIRALRRSWLAMMPMAIRVAPGNCIADALPGYGVMICCSANSFSLGSPKIPAGFVIIITP